MDNLFGFPAEEPRWRKSEPAPALFCKKWTLTEAMGKLLDIKFQDNAKFPKLLSEMYAYAILSQSKELFAFLETRFNTSIIQDKEVNLIFEVQSEPVDERLREKTKTN